MIKEAIVVLYYNKVKLTVPCVESILAAGYPAERIYCFDNGSKEDVFEEIKSRFPDCSHHRCRTNNGYSGGFNRALEWVFSLGVDSVLFCTNDTRVFPGALEACALTARKTGVGMVAPCITYLSAKKELPTGAAPTEDDAIDSIGGWFDAKGGTLNHYHERGLSEILDPVTDYIPGTALWISADFFRELGGVDESFHMYWEDVDICFRAHAKGMSMARCYEARIGHGVGQTCRKKPLYTTFYFQRNRVRFCRRYLSGDALEKAVELLRKEFQKLGEKWRENEDQKRLNYLEQLMHELTEKNK